MIGRSNGTTKELLALMRVQDMQRDQDDALRREREREEAERLRRQTERVVRMII